MTSSNEFLVVQSKNGIVGVKEIRVEDDLDSISIPVEELNTTYLAEDGVIEVIGHVMCDDRWKGVALQGKDATLEEDFVLLAYELVERWHFGSARSGFAVISGSMLENTLSNAILDVRDRVPKLFGDGLSFQCFNGIGMCLSRHNDECDDCDRRP